MKAGAVRANVGEAAIGLALAATGAAMIWFASSMGFGGLRKPGSGFLPTILGGLLLAIGLATLALALRGMAADERRVEVFGAKPLLCAVVLLGSALGFTTFGFVPTSFLFLTILFASLGEMALRRALTTAALVTLGAWLVFVRLLGVQLPSAGILGF